MADRLDLQTLLEKLLDSRNVYYQPPESVKMKYPAIRYSLASIDNVFANNSVYKQDVAYEIIVIDENPDSAITIAVSRLPGCQFNRQYKVDNLNHFVFTLYF